MALDKGLLDILTRACGNDRKKLAELVADAELRETERDKAHAEAVKAAALRAAAEAEGVRVVGAVLAEADGVKTITIPSRIPCKVADIKDNTEHVMLRFGGTLQGGRETPISHKLTAILPDGRLLPVDASVKLAIYAKLPRTALAAAVAPAPVA